MTNMYLCIMYIQFIYMYNVHTVYIQIWMTNMYVYKLMYNVHKFIYRYG